MDPSMGGGAGQLPDSQLLLLTQSPELSSPRAPEKRPGLPLKVITPKSIHPVFKGGD